MASSAKNSNLEAMRHSAAHLLAAAVLRLWPEAKPTIGPAIEDGFYYDFDFGRTKVSEEELPKIEEEMHKIVKDWKEFAGIEVSAGQAKERYKDNPYKQELIDEFANRGEKISLYQSGDFVDLCRGGHVNNPSEEIKHFKLLSVAGAYWRGDEKNPMLTRIYGTVWPTKRGLNDYLQQLEEAKERDHKKLGQELGLFTFLPVSPGMPYWYPKGLLLVHELKNFVREINKKYGYKEISTPLLAKKEVWETSGHWELFRENMFIFDVDEQTYALKPMNCPQTLLLYNTKPHSHRELPLKLSDLDVLHRYEASGTLSGLFRVRELSQDDAHVICQHSQVEEVVGEILEMAMEIYEAFGFSPSFYFATKPDKALGAPQVWQKAEAGLEKVLKEKNVSYQVKPKDGAFYGPKIDLHIEDALGRDWQLATIQLDFQMPERFGSYFINEKGEKETPVMIHKAILGSLERFLGILLENTAGALPVWLAPVQAIILPITDRNIEYAKVVSGKLEAESLRAELDDRSETLQARIRDASLAKIPYMLVVGDKEEKGKTVSLRLRTEEDVGALRLEEFIKRARSAVAGKKGL